MQLRRIMVTFATGGGILLLGENARMTGTGMLVEAAPAFIAHATFTNSGRERSATAPWTQSDKLLSTSLLSLSKYQMNCSTGNQLSRLSASSTSSLSSPSSRHPFGKRPQQRRTLKPSRLQMASSKKNLNPETPEETDPSSLLASVFNLDTIGILVQPVVWVSLGSVATTGAGLPAGPLGLLGAIEGVSYLVVVGLAATSFFRPSGQERSRPQQLSLATLAGALLVLLKLVADQGCVPNAKPILDYSDYLPVCNPQQTPGFFGGDSS